LQTRSEVVLARDRVLRCAWRQRAWVPGQQRIGRDDAGEATQGGSAKNLGPDRESAPLLVRQPTPSLAELLPQDPVLLAEVLDDVLLPVMDPAGNSEDEEVQHQGIHTTTLAAMPHREHRPRGPRKNAAGSAGSGCVGFRHSTAPASQVQVTRQVAA
jgi:hypothetical protein